MIYREIVRTCANSHIAEAAVLSLGGEIARLLSEDAHRVAMSRGDYAAQLVRNFAQNADAGERDRVLNATRGSQQPILSGLRYILERPRPEIAWMTGQRL